MNTDRAAIEALVERPSETLDVELKTWLDLTQAADIAKTVRALLALRNRNGGLLMIGFNDKTHQPDPVPPGYLPKVVFHSDEVQLLVSKYAFDPFPVAVDFVKRNGQDYPILIVESGVQYPVAVKSDLVHSGKSLLRVGEVPFRTLRANGTVSTAAARPGDWKEIMEICFQNREADIGAFIRRHLSAGSLPTILGTLAALPNPSPTLPERCEQLMETAFERFRAVLAKQGSERAAQAAEAWGTWETALVIDPPLAGRIANDAFLGTVMASVPEKDSEWPLWVDTRYWDNRKQRPVQISDGWEALI